MVDEQERKARKLRYVKQESSFLPDRVEGRLIGLNGIGLGSATLRVVELPDLTIANRSWLEPLAEAVDVSLGEEKAPNGIPVGAIHGIFGADLLMIHGAILDFSSNTMWLPPERR